MPPTSSSGTIATISVRRTSLRRPRSTLHFWLRGGCCAHGFEAAGASCLRDVVPGCFSARAPAQLHCMLGSHLVEEARGLAGLHMDFGGRRLFCTGSASLFVGSAVSRGISPRERRRGSFLLHARSILSCSRKGCLNLYLSTSSSSYFYAGSFWSTALTDVVGAYRAEDGAFTIRRLFVRPSGIPPEALVVHLVSGFEGLVYLDITCAGCRRTWRQLDRVRIQRSLYIIWNSRAAAELS